MLFSLFALKQMVGYPSDSLASCPFSSKIKQKVLAEKNAARLVASRLYRARACTY